MERKAVSGIMLTLLITCMFTLALNIQPAKASGTIYIRPDGSVWGTDKIQRDGDYYTFTDNIFDSLVVERNNIVVDGAGYKLDGAGSEWLGIELHNRNNVTVENLEIREFEIGIESISSQSLNLSRNIIANNYEGMYIDQCSEGTLSGNMMNENTYGIGIVGYSLSEFMHSIGTSNRVDGKPVYYFVNETDRMINPETYPEVGYLGLVNCINMTVERLSLSNNIDGLLLAYTNNSRIIANNVVNNGLAGVRLWFSSNNTLVENNIAANARAGVDLMDSSNNKIRGNTFSSNGLLVFDSYDNSVEGNVVNGKPLVYLENVSGHTVDYAGEVVLVNCTNIRVENLDLSSASVGLELLGTNNSRIANNNMENNYFGIFLDWSSNNTVFNNNIANNTFGFMLYHSSLNNISENNIGTNNYGIFGLRSSNNTLVGNSISKNQFGIFGVGFSDNLICHNNFINNDFHVDLQLDSINSWDNGYPSGGNYWSDYEDRYPDAQELDDSGIWDTPYVIDESNQDNYPLMELWTPFPKTFSELKTKIQQLGSEGAIDNHGVVNSLIAKLNAAQRLVDKGNIDEAESILEDDFIKQVQELSGIHITVEAADILIQSAEHIISNL